MGKETSGKTARTKALGDKSFCSLFCAHQCFRVLNADGTVSSKINDKTTVLNSYNVQEVIAHLGDRVNHPVFGDQL